MISIDFNEFKSISLNFNEFHRFLSIPIRNSLKTLLVLTRSACTCLKRNAMWNRWCLRTRRCSWQHVARQRVTPQAQCNLKMLDACADLLALLVLLALRSSPARQRVLQARCASNFAFANRDLAEHNLRRSSIARQRVHQARCASNFKPIAM